MAAASQPTEADRAGARSPLVAKLQTLADLDEEDLAILAEISADARDMAARRSIIREGDRPDHVHLMIDGWAARYKLLPDGGRQITAFLMPGDFCDLHVTVLGEMDHSISTLTSARVAFIPRETMDRVTDRPKLAKALCWSTLVDEAVLRSWIVSVGRRDAFTAVCHLICELYVRLRNIGLTDDHHFEMPLTQEEIADALGLTPVHVNRVLQRLRTEQLIALKRSALTILDYSRLQQAAGFTANYLHLLDRRGPTAAH